MTSVLHSRLNCEECPQVCSPVEIPGAAGSAWQPLHATENIHLWIQHGSRSKALPNVHPPSFPGVLQGSYQSPFVPSKGGVC